MPQIKTAARILACALLALACTEEPIREGEEHLVLTIGDLRAFGLELPPNFATYETFTRERWFDGSVTVEYEFEAPEDLALPYLYSTAERHASMAEACASFAAGSIGLKLGGADITDLSDVFEFGTKSGFGVFTFEGAPVGNVFGMCHEKKAALVVLGGFYVDDGEVWGDLMGDALQALEAWE